MEAVEIPEGAFWMGRDDGPRGERPRHLVWTPAFSIGRAPVTNREYAPFLASGGAGAPPWWSDPGFSHPDQPVVGVNWEEATAYCRWLTRQTGLTHRLPTEAEWEKAARGGRDGMRFPWGDEPRSIGPLERPPLVTTTPANPLGLLALSGACHEWCLDWEEEGYYARSPQRSPEGPPTGTRRISRGGAWRHRDPWSPVTHRSSLPPHLRYSDYGFRVVRESG